MLTRPKRLSGFVAIAAASVLVIGACSTNSGGGNKQQTSPGFASCEANPNTCNSGPTKQGGSITVAIEKKIANWATYDSDGNTFETGQVLNGIVATPFFLMPNNTTAWNQILFSEEPKVTNQDPMTVVYKLKKEAVWDDGTPMTVKDFQMYWKFNNGKACPDCTPAGTTGYELIKSIEGSDDDKTVTVTFTEPYPDWQSLFALFPSHLALKAAGDLDTPAGLAKGFEFFKQTPTWSGWAYKFKTYEKDVSVTLERNDKFWGPKPALDTVVFRIIEDQAQQLPAMQNKEIQMMISQPNADMVQKVQGFAGVNYNLQSGPTWEHIDLNLKNKYLADTALRQAIFTAINRQEIIDKTVGVYFKGAQPLNNHIIMPPGAPGYKDVITPTGQGKGDVEKAKSILTGAGYKIDGGKLIGKDGQPVPPLRFRFTTGNQGRQQSLELVQAQLKQIGVDVKIEPLTNLGNTLNTGDFDGIIFAWVGGPFLGDDKDIWVTGGGGNYGKYSNPDVDRLMNDAAKSVDPNKMRDLYNQALEIMAKDAYVLPLYPKPVFVAVYSDFINVRNNSTSNGQTYNMHEWGLKADSVK